MALSVTIELADVASDEQLSTSPYNPGFRNGAGTIQANLTDHSQDSIDRTDFLGTTGAVKWQLPTDRITHQYQNPAVPLPLPVPTGTQGDQLGNKMLDIGMRSESIRLVGVIRDVGTPSATNIRKQTLLDIARVQHSATINANEQGVNADPTNPNSYVRLTIGDGFEPSDYEESVGTIGASTSTPTYRINTNLITRDKNLARGNPITGTLADDDDYWGSRRTTKSYRGLITDLSFEMEGGRPDIWRWSMTFYVVKNEHDWILPS